MVELIHARFEAQARRRPHALAVASRLGTLTYGELDDAATGLADRLDGDGVVAILAERGPRLVVAVLACAKAGRPFAVLDLAYPEAALRARIEICRPTLALTALCGDASRAPEVGLPTLPVRLSTPRPQSLARPQTSPDAVAYLLFTSGSTGAPKCVAVSHRPLVNFVDWQARTFALSESDRFTLLSGLSHDPLLRDIFTPLSLGATLHIPAQRALTEPGALHRWFVETQPSVAHMTPPLGRLLTAGAAPGALEALRYVFWGGDVLGAGVVEALSALAPSAESVNFYGSTETPQAASSFHVGRRLDEARAPIGQGIDGFALEIRREDGGPADQGEAGEIVVRSRFLSLGYVEGGRLPPTRRGDAESVYATGDIGVRRADGQIVIRGRRDDQVKVRGYRVELAEITAAALRSQGVGQAVTLNVGAGEAVRLVCFVEGRVRAEAVRASIAAELAAYMAPDEIVPLASLPLLPNGKIDRQALVADYGAAARRPATPARAASNPVEAALIEDWKGFFQNDAIDPGSSFASLGGDSLSYVSAYLSVEERLGAVPDGWTGMTIAELAAAARPDEALRPFAQVESAMALRALAIAAVVASHFQLIFTGGGATSALLWVSGSIFGRLQLREMGREGSLQPLGRLLRSLLLPLMLLEAPQFLAKVALHHHPRLSSVLLYTDLLDYTGQPSSGPDAYGGNEYLMWYVHCVIHIVLIYAALAFVFRRLKLARPTQAAAVAALGLGLAGRFLLPVFFVPGYWSGALDPMSFFNHAPTTHLATFALAAACALSPSRWRLAGLAAALAYAALTTPIFGWTDGLPIAVVAGMLALAPKLSLPRRLSKPVYLVAGASFFIYLLQFKFLALINGALHLPTWVAFLGAVAGGVGVWSAWTWGSQRAATILRGLRATRIGWRPWVLADAR